MLYLCSTILNVRLRSRLSLYVTFFSYTGVLWLVCTSYWEVQGEKPNILLKYFPSAGCSMILCIGEKTIMLRSKLIYPLSVMSPVMFTHSESAKKTSPVCRVVSLWKQQNSHTVYLYCTILYQISEYLQSASSQPGATHCVFSPCANMCFNLLVWVKTTILHHPYQYCNVNSNHHSDTVILFCEIPMKWCSYEILYTVVRNVYL